MDCTTALQDALKDDQVKNLIAGLGLGGSPALTCRPCENYGVEGNARGFIVANPIEIVLCANRLSKNDVKEVLKHELIHAFDFVNKRVDFNSCRGLAYTEIRAAREAECSDELAFLGIKSRCIRRKATASTRNIFPLDASACVEEVFQAAVNDRSPFNS